MNSEHYNFNTKMISSMKDVLAKVAMTESTSERNLRQFRERQARNRAEREARAEELRQKRDTTNSQRNEIKARIDADIAAEIASGNTDTYAARKKVLDKLAQDQEFQLKARNAGLGTVGRKGGGLVGWNYENQQAAEEGRRRSIEGLFDKEGNAKLADTANKTWNPATGKFDTPMVGKSDNPERYAELEKEAQERTAERAAAAQQETNNRKFGYKRPPRFGEIGHPGGYINPNSPEGRIEAELRGRGREGDGPYGTPPDSPSDGDPWRRDPNTGRIIPGEQIFRDHSKPYDPENKTDYPPWRTNTGEIDPNWKPGDEPSNDRTPRRNPGARPAPAPRPAPVPPRPTPLRPQAPRPTPLQPEPERPTPLKPQEGSEDFSQLFASGRKITPPSITALSRMRRTGLA